MRLVEDPDGLADDGVVDDLFRVAVAVDEHGLSVDLRFGLVGALLLRAQLVDLTPQVTDFVLGLAVRRISGIGSRIDVRLRLIVVRLIVRSRVAIGRVVKRIIPSTPIPAHTPSRPPPAAPAQSPPGISPPPTIGITAPTPAVAVATTTPSIRISIAIRVTAITAIPVRCAISTS